jgi:hypothetical protein
VNKKQNFGINSAVPSGGQGKYMKYVYFPWPPLETALSIFNVSLFFVKNNFLRRNSEKKRKLPLIPYRNRSKNNDLETTVSVVQ